MKKYTTYYAKPSDINAKWFVIDAADETLGRLASRVAQIIRGKNKPEFTPGMDTGDFVVVINADNLKVTGKKLTEKTYYRHSGYPGGLKATSLEDQIKKDSTEVIRHAVKGMLPHNRLGRHLLSKLKVYAGSEHPHEAQTPEKITPKEG